MAVGELSTTKEKYASRLAAPGRTGPWQLLRQPVPDAECHYFTTKPFDGAPVTSSGPSFPALRSSRSRSSLAQLSDLGQFLVELCLLDMCV